MACRQHKHPVRIQLNNHADQACQLAITFVGIARLQAIIELARHVLEIAEFSASSKIEHRPWVEAATHHFVLYTKSKVLADHVWLFNSTSFLNKRLVLLFTGSALVVSCFNYGSRGGNYTHIVGPHR